MRLYAFLLLASCALAVRAASIPDSEAIQQKKIDDVLQDKTPENVASEQELLDQVNTISDVENKLRKPADIPVVVVVEDVKPVLRTTEQDDDSDDDIVRPSIDLRNPGPPQRQEHETQNPEFYAAEQQIVQIYKKNINDAENILRQGFKSVSSGIQNMLENNEQIKQIQENIQSLQEGFIAQINKLNSSVQNYMSATPAVQQTKSNFLSLETGLKALRNDFTRGLDTLSDGVAVFASIRAENEKPDANKPSTGEAPANPAPAGLGDMLIQYINRLQNAVQTGFSNLQQSINGNQQSTGQAAAPPAGAQSDTPSPNPGPSLPSLPTIQWPSFQFPWSNPNNQNNQQGQNNQQNDPVQTSNPQTGLFGSGNGPIASAISSWTNTIQNGPFSGLLPQNWPGQQTTAKPVAAPEKPSESKPEEKPSEAAQETKPIKEEKPEAQASQPAASTADGPIRQILQNNPITQGIAQAVQRLQNINNPEKPRDPVKEKADDQPTEDDKPTADDKPKGHRPGSGDNNDVDGSGVVPLPAPLKEVPQEPLPEAQEPEQKSEAVKTE